MPNLIQRLQVFNEPGVTRDRTYGDGYWGNHEFTVVDTGGLVFDDDPDQVFLPQIRQQARANAHRSRVRSRSKRLVVAQAMAALTEADVALMVVDGQDGCTPLDSDIAAFLNS